MTEGTNHEQDRDALRVAAVYRELRGGKSAPDDDEIVRRAGWAVRFARNNPTRAPLLPTEQAIRSEMATALSAAKALIEAASRMSPDAIGSVGVPHWKGLVRPLLVFERALAENPPIKLSEGQRSGRPREERAQQTALVLYDDYKAITGKIPTKAETNSGTSPFVELISAIFKILGIKAKAAAPAAFALERNPEDHPKRGPYTTKTAAGAEQT